MVTNKLMHETATFKLYRMFFVILILTGFISCKKNDSVNVETSRIFKPSAIKIVTAETSAKLTWSKPVLAPATPLKYTIDFSADSLFTTIKYTTISDTTGVTITETNIPVRTKYYARVKANATSTQPESKYVVSSSFQLTGLQYFTAIRETEIKETSANLYFQKITGLTSIVLTPESGSAVTASLSAGDISAGVKNITGLTPATKYNAELFSGTRSVGYITFTTLALTNYTQVLSPGDDLATAISNAADGAIIGLNNGTYSLPVVATLTSKSITLKSVNNDPKTTKINFKGFVLTGNGAGLKLQGIDFDGTTNSATYFADFTGSAATFKSLNIENSYIHNIGTAIIRGDRANYVIGDISFKNCKIYNVTGSSSYYLFHLDKLVFTSLNVSKSTLYNLAPGLVNCKTTLTTTPPVISFDACTINNFGFNSLYVLLNASANPVNFAVTNSIIANTPNSGTVSGTILSTGSNSNSSFNYNNYFNLLATINGTALTFPSGTSLIATQTLNLGWNASTVDFTLPTSSALRTASNSGGSIGDPQWTY